MIVYKVSQKCSDWVKNYIATHYRKRHGTPLAGVLDEKVGRGRGTYVLFSDDVTFNRDGVFNQRSAHLWAEELGGSTRHSFTLNVGEGLVGHCLVGPYLPPSLMTSTKYRIFLGSHSLIDGYGGVDRIPAPRCLIYQTSSFLLDFLPRSLSKRSQS
ncbi:hypothetical protein CEXT_630791 [Caerostris extrusa]|uniref:Uncharacterized protein n=1 Tax=Caerostris extrusa TaxID=172846 RepID=A0AAV4NHC2_CAEEX|nr:hypothetical protein CEXT_630791 [Caerostris extrusa]